MLEWRVVLKRLERFVRLCNCLVLELLQRLVMTAVCTLEHCIERVGEKSASLAKQRRQEFQKMREQVLSQPYTQSVLDRHIFDVEEEGGEDMVVKTIFFNAFMPSEGVCNYITACMWELEPPCNHCCNHLRMVKCCRLYLSYFLHHICDFKMHTL